MSFHKTTLAGGWNNLANPEGLDNDQVKETENYELLGNNVVTKRKDPFEYGIKTGSGTDLNEVLALIFTQTLAQISPPMYPIRKLSDMTGDFVMLAFGKTSGAPNTPELHLFYETATTWATELIEIDGIDYVADSYLEFSIGDDKIIITDTYTSTNNLPHYVKIDADGELISGKFGVPSPTNKATVVPVTEFDRNNYEDIATRGRLGDCGIFQCLYTVVTEEGDESNPSPISESRNMQFFEKDAVSFNDARWISSVIVANLSIPEVSDDLTNRMKYFNIYYRIIRYSEGFGAQPFSLSQRFEILDKQNHSGETGNQYAVTVESDLSTNISYENDISPIAKHAAETSSIVGFGNVKEKVSFPFDFHRYASIKVNNITNKNYVDAVVQITIFDESQPVDGINIFGKDLIDEFDLSYYFGSGGAISNINQIRIFDADMKTMLPVIYEPYAGGTSINIYVKIPLLIAGGVAYLYLCFNKNTDSPYGVDNLDYQNVEYGQWELMGENWSNQQLFQSERVKDNKSVICMPNDIEDSSEEAINRVNTLDNGEFINDAIWVDNRVGKTLITDNNEVGANKSIQLPSVNSFVKFDNLNLSSVKKGYYYGRIKYDADAIRENVVKIIALLRGAEIVVGTNYINNIGLGIDYDVPILNPFNEKPKWFVWGGEKDNPDSSNNIQAKLYFPTLSSELQPMSELNSGTAEYFVLLSFDRGERVSLFVADLVSKKYYYEEVLWSEWENVSDDEINLDEILLFELGSPAQSIAGSIYDQWQFVNGTYLSAESLDDKTAVYNIANYMPSFDRAIGIKLI